MKYTDRYTIKNDLKYQDKQNYLNSDSHYYDRYEKMLKSNAKKAEKKKNEGLLAFKTRLKNEFGESGLIWWTCLSDLNKDDIYRHYSPLLKKNSQDFKSEIINLRRIIDFDKVSNRTLTIEQLLQDEV